VVDHASTPRDQVDAPTELGGLSLPALQLRAWRRLATGDY
jgi:hypothetical protein